MATSQNNYPVFFENKQTGGLPRLRKWIIPGTGRHIVMRDGSTGFLLAHFALFFHQKVEPINEGQWDEWGYAVRAVRGQTTGYSNHASGTAMDLNAVAHPLGKVGTFDEAQAAAIRKRLKFYAGCIRWGGDYRGRKDEMHFEIDKPLKRCERRARRLMDTPRGRRILAANPGAREAILA
jgi:hypothetical protein